MARRSAARSSALPASRLIAGASAVIVAAGCTEWRPSSSGDGGADADVDARAELDARNDADRGGGGDARPDADRPLDAGDSAPDADADGSDSGSDADDAGGDGEAGPEDAGDAGPRSQLLRVTENGDDGELGSLGLLPSGEEGLALYIGFWDDTETWGYFRFELAETIPATATVTAAQLELYGTRLDASWEPSVHRLAVAIEDADDAPQVTSADDNPSTGGRTMASETVDWPATGGLDWLVDGWNASPDLSSLFQALLSSRGELAGGSHVQLWLAGYGYTENAEVGCEDWSEPWSHHARLTIEWE